MSFIDTLRAAFFPAKSSLAATFDGTISSATDITLNASTKYVEISAIDKGVFVRFAATVATDAFDFFVPANTTRVFVKPAGVTVISVLEETATAKVTVVER